MNRLQMTKRALVSYVNAVKFIWSELAYPLIIIGKKFMNLRDYRIYGNSVEEPVNLVDLSTCTYGVYIDDTGVEVSSTNTFSTSFGLTDYVNIDTNETYNVSTVGNGVNAVRINFYDADKNWLSQYSTGVIDANNTFTATIDMAENTAYIRVSGILTVLKVYHPKSVDHPVEIQSVGDLTIKNLFNYTDYTTLVDLNADRTSHLTIDGELFYIDWSYYQSGAWLAPLEQWELPSGTYTLSGKCKNATASNNAIHCGIRWIDNTVTSAYAELNSINEEWYGFSFTFTISEAKTVKGVILIDNTSSSGSSICFTNIQIEEGSTATEYEPYHKYKIPVTARGKNLLDVKKVYPNYVNDEGGITFTNSHLSRILSKNMCSEYKTGISYTFSCDYVITSEGSSVYPLLYYTDGKYIAPGGSMGGVFTGTKSGHCKVTFVPEKPVSRIVIGYSTSQKTLEAKLTNMQLEEGTIETEYEPYTEPQITNIYLDEPLRKVGVSADYVDFDKGTVARNIQENVYNGNEDWRVGTPELTNTYTFGFYRNAPKAPPYTEGKNCSLCNRFATRTTGMSSVDSEFVQLYGSHIYIRMNKSRVSSSSADEIKNWLSGNPITVNYVLAEPIEEPIELPKLPQFKGTTIYEVDTNVEPTGMKVKYC